LPRAFGSSVVPELISIEEGVGKMQAALSEARHTAMLVFARTSAVSIAGLDEGLKRLKAYETSGVDALFVPSLSTRAQLDRIAGELSLPIVLAAPDAELLDVDYLVSRRVRVCFGGHQAFSAGVKALYDAALAIRAGTAPNRLPGMADEGLMARLTKRAEYQGLDKFLKP
jgi:carboxyvinyl-carboxyphosphonate phosphorylmutase